MMFWRKPAAQQPARIGAAPRKGQPDKYGKRARAFDAAMRADLPDYIALGACTLCDWTGSDLALKDGQCVNALNCQERQGERLGVVARRATSTEKLQQRGRELRAWEIHTGLRAADGRWLGANNATQTQGL